MSDTFANNKRIAKNTLLLYLRTIFVMAISLYTSRIVLQALGVEDYGIYNVVGGIVSMFSLISGSLSGSISRFITYELGHGDKEKLKRIFSTGINIQLFLSLLIVLLAETVGFWFLNFKMNIPTERMGAANWVLHCSALAFVINLISVPYNAVIVAHEKMSAFAYISIFDALLKLLVAYLIIYTSWDKLIYYSILYVVVAIILRLVYGIYCTRNFVESRYQWVHDNNLIKEMSGFAGWTFFSSTAYLFNTQGVNILINLFFNVGINAARGIATQVQSAMMQFVTNFTTAINPQITKLYAAGNITEMKKLVIRGAKFTGLLSLILFLPVLMETDYILQLWLVEVPDHTAAFIRLAIIGTMIDYLGNTLYTACMATGRIRRYVILITSVGCLVFPLTLLCFYLGAPVESTYVIFAVVYIFVDASRLYIMRGLLSFPVGVFIREVVIRILIVSAMAIVLPIAIVMIYPQSFLRLVLTTIITILSSSLATYYIGLTFNERIVVKEKLIIKVKNLLTI